MVDLCCLWMHWQKTVYMIYLATPRALTHSIILVHIIIILLDTVNRRWLHFVWTSSHVSGYTFVYILWKTKHLYVSKGGQSRNVCTPMPQSPTADSRLSVQLRSFSRWMQNRTTATNHNEGHAKTNIGVASCFTLYANFFCTDTNHCVDVHAQILAGFQHAHLVVLQQLESPARSQLRCIRFPDAPSLKQRSKEILYPVRDCNCKTSGSPYPYINTWGSAVATCAPQWAWQCWSKFSATCKVSSYYGVFPSVNWGIKPYLVALLINHATSNVCS